MILELCLDATLDLSRSEARHGFGLFETLRVKGGRPLRLAAHLERLGRGAAFLEMPPPPTQADLEAFLVSHTQVPAMGSGVLRLFAVDTKLIVYAMAYEAELPRGAHLGLAGSLVRHSSSPLNRYKTLAYLENRILSREARNRDLFEVVALNERGELTDGSRTTLFVVTGGRILTPPTESGALPGVARRVLLEAGLAEEAALKPAHLDQIEGAFLTNSLHGAIPVRVCRERTLAAPDLGAVQEALEQG